jgi:hypothetical protein
LLRWDGFHLVADLEQVEAVLREKAGAIGYVEGIRLTGAGDAIDITVVVAWKAIRARVAMTIGEIRLKRRFLGFQIRRLKVFGGLRIPKFVVESILGSLEKGPISVVRGSGIVVVDMRDWIPAEADVSIVTVQATRTSVHVWFGPGGLEKVPGRNLELPGRTAGALASGARRAG